MSEDGWDNMKEMTSVLQTSKSQQIERKEKVGKTNQKKQKENLPSNKRKGPKRLIKGYANH